ncbi:nitrogenase cofactor biosynthesis protein NifB [Deferrisoma camini]|uniref:nitrogenase cofactor biosynthesis protein NifB n=1 Tax=Deferrisoma camini TaxID=1035120 RepID=UPI00046D63A8|nr:nitrogenase cofactor biosynthesis protein NifB [Deferrisoma camini]
MNPALDLNRHPCFHAESHGHCGRIHLPVAPRCNLKCAYCNRRYNCVNESRPGVTSAVLSPHQAVGYLERVVAAEPRISVVGIAGPGDPFANPDETLTTLRLVRERCPEMLLCVATNALGLPPLLDELPALGVTHVTVTVNAVDPAVGASLYAWARDGKVIYRGPEAAAVLLERQRLAVTGLKARGILVKVNCIVVPGVNDHHVAEVARTVAGWGADVLNVMGLVPTAGTPLADVPEPGPELLRELRAEAERFLPQMRHCRRCRADAVGLLGEDRSGEFAPLLQEAAEAPPPLRTDRPHVAVATREGMLVNQHLGEARSFQVWARKGAGFLLVEERPAPPPGGGPDRWRRLAEGLGDCRAVLVSGVGEGPRAILTEAGVVPIEMDGFIELGLSAVFSGVDPTRFRRRRAGCSRGPGCGGDGSGCG